MEMISLTAWTTVCCVVFIYCRVCVCESAEKFQPKTLFRKNQLTIDAVFIVFLVPKIESIDNNTYIFFDSIRQWRLCDLINAETAQFKIEFRFYRNFLWYLVKTKNKKSQIDRERASEWERVRDRVREWEKRCEIIEIREPKEKKEEETNQARCC